MDKKEYKASVTREGKWWMISVPEIDGLTQARRLAEVELMARELVAVATDTPIDSIEVAVSFRTIGTIVDVNAILQLIGSEREEAARLEKQATRQAIALAKELVASDIPLRDVGTVLGVSHQRAHQLVNS